MASTFPSSPDTYGFNDLHSFKDFVCYVYSYAPDQFPVDDWRVSEDQMNLDRAFAALQQGLALVMREKGELSLVASCRALVDESYEEYKAGRDHEGQLKLEKVEELLAKLST